MKEKQGRAIAIYSRKSKFTGVGESIENQVEMCKQYLQMHFPSGEADNILVYEDEGFSGGSLERPQFKKMMKDIQDGKIKCIIVYRLDRISRNISDFSGLIEDLNAMNVGFLSVKESFDTTTPMGKAMMYICSVFSQLERETIAERIRDNMHELAKTGRWLGGTSPTGYTSAEISNVTIDGKTRKACKLVEIPEEISLIKLIFDKFVETNALCKTEKYLLQSGYVTKNGKNFTRFAIKNILTNPVYMIADEDALNYLKENHVNLYSEASAFDGTHGIMAYNRSLQISGKSTKIKPMDEWICSVGKHQGIIPGKTWIKVQQCLSQNKSKAFRKPRSNVALLSGLLRCGNCGEYMRPKKSSRVNAKGEFIYSYLCNLKERSGLQCCNMKNVNGNILDETIIEQIKSLSEDGSEFLSLLEKSKKSLISDKAGYEDQIRKLEGNITENKNAITNLVTTLSKATGSTAESYLLQQITELDQKNNELNKKLDDLKKLSQEKNLSDAEFDVLADMLSSFKDTVDDMTIEQKRAAIRAFVKQVIWDGEKIHVILFGSDYDYPFPKVSVDKSGSSEESDAPDDVITTPVEPLGENSK